MFVGVEWVEWFNGLFVRRLIQFNGNGHGLWLLLLDTANYWTWVGVKFPHEHRPRLRTVWTSSKSQTEKSLSPNSNRIISFDIRFSMSRYPQQKLAFEQEKCDLQTAWNANKFGKFKRKQFAMSHAGCGDAFSSLSPSRAIVKRKPLTKSEKCADCDLRASNL